MIRILSHWMRYFLDIGFDYGYRKCSSIWNYSFPLLVVMLPFSTGTGLKHVWGRWAGPGMMLG